MGAYLVALFGSAAASVERTRHNDEPAKTPSLVTTSAVRSCAVAMPHENVGVGLRRIEKDVAQRVSLLENTVLSFRWAVGKKNDSSWWED